MRTHPDSDLSPTNLLQDVNIIVVTCVFLALDHEGNIRKQQTCKKQQTTRKNALLHFIGLASNSKGQQLMPQTNSKQWFLFVVVQKFFDVLNGR